MTPKRSKEKVSGRQGVGKGRMNEAVQGEASQRKRRLVGVVGWLLQSQIHPKFTFSKLFWKQKADVPKPAWRHGRGHPCSPASKGRQWQLECRGSAGPAGFMSWQRSPAASAGWLLQRRAE